MGCCESQTKAKRDPKEKAEDPQIFVQSSSRKNGDEEFAKTNYSEAQKHYRQHLQYVQQQKGQKSLAYAQALKNIGYVKEGTGQYLEAVGVFQQALKIQEDLKGQNSAETIQTHTYIGILYYSENDHESATKSLQKAIEISEKHNQTKSYEFAEANHYLGNINYCSQNYYVALEHLEKTAVILENDKDHEKMYRSTLNKLVTGYKKTGDNKKQYHYFNMLQQTK